MSRQKVKHDFIMDESKRKATFKRRANGFINKVKELTILCGINACAIVNNPYDVIPMVWPNPLGVQRVISQYNNMPEVERSKQMFNQETYLTQRIGKVNEELMKKQTQNHDEKVIELMFECLSNREERVQNLSQSNLNDLRGKLEKKLIEINKRMEGFRNTSNLQQVSIPLSESQGLANLQNVASPLPIVALPVTTPLQQVSMLMPMQQVAPSHPSTLSQPWMPMQQVELSQPPTLLQPWMPMQQVAPTQPLSLPQPWVLMAMQQVAPHQLDPALVPIVASGQMQQNIEQVQEHNHQPQQFNNWVNQPMNDMVHGQVQENQIVMPLINNSTIAWPNTYYDPASAHLAPNPYGFL